MEDDFSSNQLLMESGALHLILALISVGKAEIAHY
jgi:hypothetical protein